MSSSEQLIRMWTDAFAGQSSCPCQALRRRPIGSLKRQTNMILVAMPRTMFRKALQFGLASLLLSSAALPTSAEPASGDALSKIRIYNFGRISEQYYRGAQPKEQDYATLASLGIRTVIDLQKKGDKDEPGRVQAAGMKYVRIPMTTRQPPSNDDLKLFLSIVNDPVNQPVYVHCAEGRHRTGVMTAVYRMTGDGWSPDQAFKEMKQYRFGFDFLHPEFKRFVFAYTRPETTAADVAAPIAPALGVTATQ